jgi:hypothetical protein
VHLHQWPSGSKCCSIKLLWSTVPLFNALFKVLFHCEFGSFFAANFKRIFMNRFVKQPSTGSRFPSCPANSVTMGKTRPANAHFLRYWAEYLGTVHKKWWVKLVGPVGLTRFATSSHWLWSMGTSKMVKYPYQVCTEYSDGTQEPI